MDDLKQFYTSQVRHFSSEIQRLRHRSRWFIMGEITSFLAFIGFVAVYTAVEWGVAAVCMSFFSFVLYLAIRYADIKNNDSIELLEATCGVYEKELKYLSGDFSCFGDGAQYVDPKHQFTFDMDIFGRDSLFNRINRTVTSGGSDFLARCLKRQFVYDGAEEIKKINMRREAINKLAGMETLRTAFISKGHKGVADTYGVLQALDNISNIKLPAFAVSSSVSFAVVLLILLFYVIVLLSVFTSLDSSVPVMWGILQFFAVFMLCSRPLRDISKVVNSLHGHLRTYLGLIRLIANSDLGNITDSCFSSEKLDSMRSFDELKTILDMIDRRGNVLGLVLFDTFLLSDFFLVRRFAKWRNNSLCLIRQWIDAVSTVDALVSMATFRYNEPQAVDAEVLDTFDIVYDAKGLYHPFIGVNAVRNDFNIADGNYYIVTGANMAGKSTFLRSLGVNYVLAMNGIPVFADSLRVSVFSLFSSMRTADDLTQGISYFNAELLRLKQLMDECTSHGKTLIILDEILKGTNSLDKLNGSRLFLQEISKFPVSGVIATHDLELSKMCEEYPGRFHNYCFEIGMSDKITYTYKITQGVARNQNATYLLENIILKNRHVDVNQ